MSTKRSIRMWLLADAAALLATAGCDRMRRKSPEESAREQLVGQWQDANSQMKLEFLPDGAARGRLNVEFNTLLPVALGGAARTLPATLIGAVEFSARYRFSEAAHPEVYLPVECGGRPLNLLLVGGKLAGGELALETRHFRMPPAKLGKRAAELKTYGAADLEKGGYHVPDLSGMSGIMVGDNVFMAMGSMSAGAMKIAQGYTIQDVPKSIELPVTFEHEATGGRMLLTSPKPPSFLALVYTNKGFRLLTSYDSKSVAYRLSEGAAAAIAPHALGGVYQGHVEGKPTGSLTFSPRFVSFTNPKE